MLGAQRIALLGHGLCTASRLQGQDVDKDKLTFLQTLPHAPRTHPQSSEKNEKPKALPPGRSALHCSHLWHCPLFQDAAGKHVLSDVLTLSYTQRLVGCRMANQLSALCNASGCYVSGGSELIAVEAAEVQMRT